MLREIISYYSARETQLDSFTPGKSSDSQHMLLTYDFFFQTFSFQMALTEHKRWFIIDCAYEEDTAVILLVKTDTRWTPISS